MWDKQKQKLNKFHRSHCFGTNQPNFDLDSILYLNLCLEKVNDLFFPINPATHEPTGWANTEGIREDNS